MSYLTFKPLLVVRVFRKRNKLFDVGGIALIKLFLNKAPLKMPFGE